MSPYELMDIAQSVANRIDVQWGFFITVHMAILGGIVYVDRPLTLKEKLVGTALYIILAFFNFRILTAQLDLLEAVYRELVVLAELPAYQSLQLLDFFVDAIARDRFKFTFWVSLGLHTIAFVVVVGSIATDRARSDGR